MERNSLHSAVQEALKLLRIERLIIAIHDQCFPSCPDEEIGRGSPYSQGAERFLAFVRSLGFNGVQFGPQGKTSPFNLSPYDGTLFSRNDMAISLKDLAENRKWHTLLDRGMLKDFVSRCPATDNSQAASMPALYAQQSLNAALGQAFKHFVGRASDLTPLWTAFDQWTRKQHSVAGDWLKRDALFDALSLSYGSDDWSTWSDTDRNLYAPSIGDGHVRARRIEELCDRHADEIRYYEFCQFIVHQQHDQLRTTAAAMGLKLYGDLQIGFSGRDKWSRRDLLLPDYLMGAPPSRTNPDGQPWGYPVLDPRLYGQKSADSLNPAARGPVLDFFSDRARKMLDEFDGIRIDHPHGLVDPWVYRASEPDAMLAVQNGARLFSSPNISNHPALAHIAIARQSQITSDPNTPRYADDWVVDLTDEQVERYGVLVECILSVMREKSDQHPDIVCEVLSTCPYPLKRVLNRYALGRFRVTQKADLARADDGYRSENAEPTDLIMVGNHDTKPLWLVVDEWARSGQLAGRAQYLAERLQPDADKRAAFAASLAADKSKLAQAMFADLFASPAENISIFFADLLGMKEIYNEPGTFNEKNWSLRVPHDYENLYHERSLKGEALSLPVALSMALRARYANPSPQVEALIARLGASSFENQAADH